ncbi:MAG: D-alanine--D-alanine ligase [Proteobacteria bacterium]|nr:D-alanine--D-alanine ligase [Pseudomonadota bacterium]
MLIGITYDLRSAYLAMGFSEEDTAEFDRDDTIDAIEQALTNLGHQADRIGNIRQLVGRLAAGNSWDLVFNICEGLYGTAREGQVPAILEAYGIPCTFSDAALMALSLHKAWTKDVLADSVPIAGHRVIYSAEEAEACSLPSPWFVKPLCEGTGKGVTPNSLVRMQADLVPACASLLKKFKQPVLLETYLPGREFTVSILGTGDQAYVLGTTEIVLLATAEPEVYSYINKEDCENRVENRLVSATDDPVVRQAEEVAMTVWRELKCRDAGRVDLRCDSAGEPHFMEVNPLAGMHPLHSDLPMCATDVGMPYQSLIEKIVHSASARIEKSSCRPIPKVA